MLKILIFLPKKIGFSLFFYFNPQKTPKNVIFQRKKFLTFIRFKLIIYIRKLNIIGNSVVNIISLFQVTRYVKDGLKEMICEYGIIWTIISIQSLIDNKTPLKFTSKEFKKIKSHLNLLCDIFSSTFHYDRQDSLKKMICYARLYKMR